MTARPLARLIETRKAAGYSQAQMGAAIGKSQSQFGKIERGEIGLSARDALILCNLLDLTIQSLMETPE